MKARPRNFPSPAYRIAYLRGLLHDAKPTTRERVEEGEACEARRVKAVNELLTIYRDAVVKADDIEPPPLEPRTRLRAMRTEDLQDVLGFLEIEGLRIFAADDPVAELKRFVGDRPRPRGHPMGDNEDRDFRIAMKVFELRASRGGTGRGGRIRVDDACDAVGKGENLSLEAVQKIYKRFRRSLGVDALELASCNLQSVEAEK